jgi:streptomycin 6-kinase
MPATGADDEATAWEHPDLFADPVVIQRRVRRFCDALDLRAGRVLAWAFAQAILSAVWTIEDGPTKPASTPSLRLAEVLWPVVNRSDQGIGDAG